MAQQFSEQARSRRDVIEGSRPALYLALGIGLITGAAVALVLILTIVALGAIGGIGSGARSVVTLLGVSITFWLGISLGVTLGLMAGFRAWVALYPAYERRAAAAERRAAIDEVESWLREPSGPPSESSTGD